MKLLMIAACTLFLTLITTVSPVASGHASRYLCQDLFDLEDTNRDKFYDLGEHLGLYKSCDKNVDGLVTFQEMEDGFRNNFIYRLTKTGLTSTYYEAFDLNDDNYIDPLEVRKLHDEMDTNDDKRITKLEFAAFCEMLF